MNGVRVLAGTRKGAILVDMTSTSPPLAVEIDAAARQRGATAIDAPVSGGDVGARNAALSIMVGGDKALVTGRFVLTGAGRPDRTGVFSTLWLRTAAGWRMFYDHSG